MTTASSGPAVLGPYRLLRSIGEGGMGVVHLASGPDGRRVALKVLRPHVVGDREGRARLAREVASLQRVRSHRVAEFLDADPWGPTPYVVTRFVPGLSLSEYVGEYGPLRGQPLLRLAGGLAEAMAAVHAVGVVHRDVKPSNVLLEGQDPVLIDFGLARVAEDAALTMTGWMLGTPAYLTPEIALGEEPGPATDVHSWASTVAFACRGTSAFGRGPQAVLLDRVRRNDYSLDGVPTELHDVLVRCLDIDPRARPPATVLAGWLAGSPGTNETVTVHVPAAPEQPRVAPPPAVAAPRLQEPAAESRTAAGSAGSATALLGSGAPSDVTARRDWSPAGPMTGWAAGGPAGGPADGMAGATAAPVAGTTAATVPGTTGGMAGATSVGPASPPGPPTRVVPAVLGPLSPAAPPRPWTERLASAVLWTLLSAWLVALFAAAPYVTAGASWVVVGCLVTWARAVEARHRRRSVRGVRRGDGVVATFLAPWHAAAGIAQATVLVGAGLLAAALVDGLLNLGSVQIRHLVWAGAAAFALVLWRGPGGHVLHRPVHRAVARGSSAGVWSLGLVWLLAALVAGTIGLVQGTGTAWFPADGPPL